MSLFHCMCGIAGAGKSTLAFKLAEADDCIIICPDQLREQLTGDAADQSKDKEVWGIAHNQLQKAFSNEENVIFDATNLTRIARKQILRELKRSGKEDAYLKVLHYFPISAEDAINRQSWRARKVPASVIIRQQHKLEYPTFAEGWDGIIKHTIDGKVDAHYASDSKE